MLYITTYTILTYQTPQENLGKFSYKLDMKLYVCVYIYIYIYIIIWILTDHNLTTSNLINFKNGKIQVTYISRVRSKKM
jgi:hypothetical protein